MICTMILKSVLVSLTMVSVIMANAEIAVPLVNPASTVVTAEAAPAGVAHIPAHVGTAISKTVHYAEMPMVTGYTSTLYKPDLSAFETPFRFNPPQRYLRLVKTLVPKLIPLEFRSIKEVEVQPPILPEIRIANAPPVYYPSPIAPLIR